MIVYDGFFQRFVVRFVVVRLNRLQLVNARPAVWPRNYTAKMQIPLEWPAWPASGGLEMRAGGSMIGDQARIDGRMAPIFIDNAGAFYANLRFTHVYYIN